MAEETHNSMDGRAHAVVQAGRIRELHQHLPGPTAPGQPTPFQVPPVLSRFENREYEQERISRAVAEHADHPGHDGPLVVALSGIGGIGKTALGFRMARRLGDRYPDGVLYLDLDDLRRDGIVEVAEALGELLTGLGVAPEWLERTPAGRSKQYWTRTRDARLLVIVDNARYGAEVLPLLPASSRGLALVAGQGVLYDLDGPVSVEVPVGPLAEDDAVRLLRGIADDPRLTDEPERAAELVRGCGGLPAALQVAGRWIRRYRRRSLSRLVTGLTAELREKGVPMVEAVWDAAYAGLGPDPARLYRLLPLHPGPALTEPVAAALLGCGAERAGDALEELESAGLLESRHGGYRMHELLRGHAERRAREAGERGRTEELTALIRWYRRQAARADLTAAGTRMIFAPLPPPSAPDIPFTGRTDALRWLNAERPALYGCVRAAHEAGLYEDAWALCEPLWTHFLDHPHHGDVTDVFRTGVAAADHAECLPAMIRMRCQLARPLWEQELYDEAEDHLRHALNAAAALDESHRKLKASAVEFQGLLKFARGDLAGAAAGFEASRAVHEEIGNRYGVLLQTHLLGRTALSRGHADEAVSLLTEAHRMAREQDRERMTARTGFELGRALRRAGRTTEAEPLVRAALVGARERGSTTDEARILGELADLRDERGEPAEARRHRQEAHRLITRSGGLPDEPPGP